MLSFALCSSLLAQDFKREYKKAKEQYNNGNYNLALEAFKPLMVYDRNNPYPEYACFYYALSAHRLGFATLAKEMFLQIKKIYPNWNQLDDVNYWLIKIYLEQNEYFRAWQLSKEIKNAAVISDVDPLKKIALQHVDDVETLKMLLEENPNDEIISYALSRAIGAQMNPADTGLFNTLVETFHWKREDFIIQKAKPIFKERYRVGLLLPFRTSTLDAGPGKKKSQLTLDLYQGMLLAADSLKGEGIAIDLLAYDTDHDATVIKNLLKEEEMKSLDLIIGPLFLEDAKLVQEFSQANKINLLVNPLSYNQEMLGANPYAFLFQPAYSTMGEKSADLIAETVANKNCFVFFGSNSRDSAMAASFIREASKLGLKIPHLESVSIESSGEILETLATATEFDEWKNPQQFTLKLDSIGSIFVASDEPLIYTKVINSVETRGDSVTVVGQESWLEDNSVDLSKFERIKVAFASPNFTPIEGQPYSLFRKKYLQKHGVLPNMYAQKGYETLIVLGRALRTFGVYFQEGLMKNRITGALTSGYQMQTTRDNGIVPFISFRGGRLLQINKP